MTLCGAFALGKGGASPNCARARGGPLAAAGVGFSPGALRRLGQAIAGCGKGQTTPSADKNFSSRGVLASRGFRLPRLPASSGQPRPPHFQQRSGHPRGFPYHHISKTVLGRNDKQAMEESRVARVWFPAHDGASTGCLTKATPAARSTGSPSMPSLPSSRPKARRGSSRRR